MASSPSMASSASSDRPACRPTFASVSPPICARSLLWIRSLASAWPLPDKSSTLAAPPSSNKQPSSNVPRSQRLPTSSASSRCSDTGAAMKVDGKVIVITGAARGIGQEYARYFAGLGARLVIADINDCAQTLDLVHAEKGTAVSAKLDVANAASAMDMARAALDAFGRIDALINNAALFGGLKGGRFDTIAETEWDAAMAVNVKGIWNCCKAVVPGHATGRRRQHRHYRLAGGHVLNAVWPALHDVQGCRHRAHARARPRTRPRQHPRQCPRAERGLDRRGARILRGKGGKGTRYHQDGSGDRAKS